MSGYYINSNYGEPIAEKLFVYFFPHVASNIAYVRAIGQFFAIEYLRKRGEKADEPEILKQFYETFSHTDKKLNMVKKFDEVLGSFEQILTKFDIRVLLTTPFDEFGEILHDSVTDRLKSECIEMIGIIKLVKKIFCNRKLINRKGGCPTTKEGRIMATLFVIELSRS